MALYSVLIICRKHCDISSIQQTLYWWLNPHLDIDHLLDSLLRTQGSSTHLSNTFSVQIKAWYWTLLFEIICICGLDGTSNSAVHIYIIACWVAWPTGESQDKEDELVLLLYFNAWKETRSSVDLYGPQVKSLKWDSYPAIPLSVKKLGGTSIQGTRSHLISGSCTYILVLGRNNSSGGSRRSPGQNWAIGCNNKKATMTGLLKIWAITGCSQELEFQYCFAAF